MSESNASESIRSKIKKLVQEKHLLNSRLNTLNREITSNLNTRSRKNRELQTNACRNRIAEIENELKKQKYLLARAEERPIDEISESLEKFAFDPSKKVTKFRSLEDFIDKSSKMFGKFPPLVHSPVEKSKENVPEKSPESNIESVVTTTSAEQPATTSADELTSSTPKAITNLKGIVLNPSEIPPIGNISNILTTASSVITSNPPKTLAPTIPIQKTQHKFNFPPTYESYEDRLIRLEREKALREEFDYNMLIQDHIFNKDTGAIPKAHFQTKFKENEFAPLYTMPKGSFQTKPQFTEKQIYLDSGSNQLIAPASKVQTQSRPPFVDLKENFIPPSVEDLERKISNLSKEHDENTWNENAERFATYKATPERMPNRFIRPQSSFDSLHVYHDSFDDIEEEPQIPQRKVQFDEPPFQTRKASFGIPNINPNYSNLNQEIPRCTAQARNATFDIPNRDPNYNDLDQEFPRRTAQARNATFDIPNRNLNFNREIPRRTVRFAEPQTQQRSANSDLNIPQRNASYNDQDQDFIPQRYTQSGTQPPFSPNNSNINFNFPHSEYNSNRNISHRSQSHSDRNEEHSRSSFLRRLRLIPKFNGESFKDLKDFIDIAETLYFSCINATEEQELFEHLALQLRGEAKTLINRLDNFDWQTIKNSLLTHFSYLANKNVISSQLENLHQEKDESLSEYTERARKLLREKNAVYNNLTEEQRLEHNRLARRAFSKGVSNPRLRDRLTTRGASSLEDAIAFAIEAENDAITDIPRSELFCRFCRFNGHRENECRRKENANSDIGKLASALRSMGNGFNRNRNNFRPNQRNFGSNGFSSNNFGSNNFGSNRNMNSNWNNRNWNNQNSNRNWNNENSNRNWNGNGNNANNNLNRNWNNNNNFNANNSNNNRNGNGFNSQPNRGNWQQNQRQQQRSNNFIRRARINAITRDTSNDECSSDNFPSSGWSSDGWTTTDCSSDAWSSDGWTSDDSTGTEN